MPKREVVGVSSGPYDGDLDDADSILRYTTDKSLSETIQNGIAGILMGIAASLISGILSVADLLIKPIDALALALQDVVRAFIVEPLMIIVQGARTSAFSLAPGGGFDLGPFTLALGIGSVLLGYWVLSKYLRRGSTSNVIPGAPFDISLPWFREEEGDPED
jgi:hypothetical protein